MNKIQFLFIFLLLSFTSSAQNDFRSGFDRDIVSSLFLSIKSKQCVGGTNDKSRAEIIAKISTNTEIICVYYYTSFMLKNFDYSKNFADFLQLKESTPIYYLVKKNGITDTVFGAVMVAANKSENDSCFDISEPDLFYRQAETYDKLRPVLSQIDIKRCSVFYLIGSFHYLYVKKNNKIFVVDGNHLVLFNDYFKKKSPVKNLRKYMSS